MTHISNAGQSILDAFKRYRQQNPLVVKQTPQVARTLPKSVVAAQQSLSEKFGIPTFDIQGRVSTIPRTVPLNPMINVGVGATGLSINSLNELLSRLTPPKPTVPTQEVFSPGLGIITLQPVGSGLTPGEFVVPSAPGLFDSLKGGLSDIQRTIGPAGIIIGIGLVALLLLKR